MRTPRADQLFVLAAMLACVPACPFRPGCTDSTCAEPDVAATPDGEPAASDAQFADAHFADVARPDGGAVPYLASDYLHTFTPSGTRYLNDHTLVRDPITSLWHLFGITFTNPGNPFMEHSFLHATAPSLSGPWTELPDALAADPMAMEGDCCVWAPHVVALPPGSSARWLMIYWATAGNGSLRRATSNDLTTWTRVASDQDPATALPGGRDPFLTHIDDRWILYSVGAVAGATTGSVLGQIVFTWTRSDPSVATDWSNPTTAATTDPVPNYPWGDLESPTVVPYGGFYYLFTTRTADSDLDYFREVVLRSPDPTHFDWQPVTELLSHAGEVVRDGDDWYLTSAGWTMFTGELNRGLLIAPMRWAP